MAEPFQRSGKWYGRVKSAALTTQCFGSFPVSVDERARAHSNRDQHTLLLNRRKGRRGRPLSTRPLPSESGQPQTRGTWFGSRGSQVQILSPRPIISRWIRFGIAWSGFGLRLAATVPRTTGAPSRDQPRIDSFGQTFARRSTMSGNFFTKVISSAACAFGRHAPAPISSVRGFVRRKVATGRDLISLSGSIFPARAASERPARVLDSRTPR